MNLNKENIMPDVSVITVNYKGYKDTCEFINSWLATITSVSYELIIIDNASPTEDFSLLKKQFPAIDYPMITFIESKENLGFAGGNNLGIKAAKGRYLFFLNNDVLLIDDTLRSCLKRLDESEKIAALSPLLLNCDKEQSIQFAGYTPLSIITLRNRALGVGSTNRDAFPATQTPYLHGAAMLIKKSVVDKVGYMPEFYFLYYEELDWCTQIRELGYELW
ncbi:MAG: glycosyltransferase family 2 protein, partial [Phocaeicola sp.]